jgi:hypothetical protein
MIRRRRHDAKLRRFGGSGASWPKAFKLRVKCGLPLAPGEKHPKFLLYIIGNIAMRTFALAVVALLASGSAALAAPASVSVTVGPELSAKAVKTYGVKEVDRLAATLRRDVERELTKTGAYDGARVELVLVDAQPNRPTFKQLGDVPGLSYESFGIGGAKIEGQIVAADGAVTPIGYKYYESDIRYARANWTWSDAEWTFDRFAARLGRGQALASR